jgi:mannosyltransferase OCH1-like enzyme
MIPNIIHQIWVGEYEIPERERRTSQELKDNHPGYIHRLWTDKDNPIDNLVPHKLQRMYKEMYDRKDYVFCADMIRWIVVYMHGGWYLDIDWEFKKRLDEYVDLSKYDGIVFGHWGVGWQHCDYTITNNVFGFSQFHPLALHMIDAMADETGYQNAPYSPGWAGKEVKAWLGLENEFSNEIWYYHDVMRMNLEARNIYYGDYNVFQDIILKHHALYAWEHTNKEKFAKGLMK